MLCSDFQIQGVGRAASERLTTVCLRVTQKEVDAMRHLLLNYILSKNGLVRFSCGKLNPLARLSQSFLICPSFRRWRSERSASGAPSGQS